MCKFDNKIGLLVAQVHLPASSSRKKTLEGDMYSQKNSEFHLRICVLVSLVLGHLE